MFATSVSMISDEVVQTLSERRSVRRYLTKPVPQELLEEIVRLAICAPSAHNRQPWRFVIMQDDKTKARLAKRMGDKLRKDRLADNDSEAAIEADVTRSFARITSAPVIVLLCLSMEDMDVYNDKLRSTHEYHMAIQSTAMAGQNLMLAAHAAGLSSCWMCAPMFCPELVQDELNIGQHWIPQGMITVGYPANLGKPYKRKPMSDVIHYLEEVLVTETDSEWE